MAQMKPLQEPQSAAEYDDRTTAAVKSVLIEIGQILGTFKGKFAIIGGAVPWLLLANEDMPHVGTLDVDVGLDAEALDNGMLACQPSGLLPLLACDSRVDALGNQRSRFVPHGTRITQTQLGVGT